MGTHLSSCVNEYLEYEEFPHDIAKAVQKAFEKAVRARGSGAAEKVLEELQSGDTDDHGRNEQAILGALAEVAGAASASSTSKYADLQRDCVMHLYLKHLQTCELFTDGRIGAPDPPVRRRSGSAASVPLSDVEQTLGALCSAVERHTVGPHTVVKGTGDASGDAWLFPRGLVLVRRGVLELRQAGRVVATAERGSIIGLGALADDEVTLWSPLEGDAPSHFDYDTTSVGAADGPVTYGKLGQDEIGETLAASRASVPRAAYARHRQARAAEKERQAIAKHAEHVKRKSVKLVQCITRHDERGALEALEAGADVNFSGSPLGRTALHSACTHRQAGSVTLLLNAGATVDALDAHFSTPLHLACEVGWSAGVKLLLEAGADLSKRNDRGDTPVHLAAAAAHVAVLQHVTELRLRGMHVPLDTKNGGGKVPFDVCATLAAKRALQPKTDLGGARRGVR